MDSDADEVLLERWRDGEGRAFAALVERYQRPIFNAAFRIVGHEEDARDITQLVFLRVAERIEDYDPRYRFFSWIYRIAVNESLNQLRAARREERLEEESEMPGLPSADPEWQANEAEVAARIQRALMSMRPSDRVVLTLRHFSDCSYEEIGRILDIEVKTVKSRLFEARQRLRELLEDLRAA